jgi:Chlorophyllase
MRCLHVAAICLGLACGSSAAPRAPDDAALIEEDATRPVPDAARPAADVSPTADAAASDSAGPAETPAPDAASAGWPPVADYGAPGPYAIARDRDTGPGGANDVFRPAAFDPGRKHPIISWANGTLFSLTDYQKLLEHWASHGFVVIAGHTNSTAGGGTHKAGIDWMVAENGRSGSPYLGALDPKMIGAAGHSQGGGATIAAGSNKPGPTGLVTTLPLMPILSFESDKSVLGKQLVPMLNINASMDDRDPSGAVANQIFTDAKMVLVQASFIGVHEDAMSAAMHRPTLAWFRLYLMGDEAARPLFFPPATCGLCKDAAWKQVRHKNVP